MNERVYIVFKQGPGFGDQKLGSFYQWLFPFHSSCSSRSKKQNLGEIRVVVRMKANYGIVLLDPEGVFEHEEGL